MELPIRVMIVLFVALVVGSMIILFARDVVDNAKREIVDIGKKEPEKIVDKEDAPVSASEIAYLAQSCYETRSNQVLSRELCYLIHGNIQASSSAVDSQLTALNVPHTVASFSAGIRSLSIYYDPYPNDMVEIKP